MSPLVLAPSHSSSPLSLSGPLGPSWVLRKPWEPSEAFGSLGSSVRLRDLAPPPPHYALLPLPSHSPHPLSLPGPLGPSWGLRKPCEPWVFSQTQGPGSPPPHSALLPLILSLPHHLSLPGPLRPSWGLRKPWEPSEAFDSLGSSVRLRGLAPPTPITPSHSP